MSVDGASEVVARLLRGFSEVVAGFSRGYSEVPGGFLEGSKDIPGVLWRGSWEAPGKPVESYQKPPEKLQEEPATIRVGFFICTLACPRAIEEFQLDVKFTKDSAYLSFFPRLYCYSFVVR